MTQNKHHHLLSHTPASSPYPPTQHTERKKTNCHCDNSFSMHADERTGHGDCISTCVKNNIYVHMHPFWHTDPYIFLHFIAPEMVSFFVLFL